MGKLADIIRGKVDKIISQDDGENENKKYTLMVEDGGMIPSPVQVEIDEKTKGEATTAYFNRSWLGKVALHRGYVINPDDRRVNGILAALNRKNGFCPCGGTGAQFKCPCQIMREYGICKCGLFLNVPDREIHGGSGSSGGRIEK